MLTLLVQANCGDSKSLEKVFKLAYGRIGKRRYDLLEPWLEPDIPVDHHAVGDLSSARKPLTFELELPSAFAAILAAQHAHKLARKETELNNIKRDIPKTNAWGRQMPACRVRNMKRKLYNTFVKKVLPPLPVTEYERVRGFALDQRPLEPIPKRRGHIPNEAVPMNVLGKTLTPKKVQRIFRKIWLLSSTISRDHGSEKWKVEWADVEQDIATSFEARPADSFLLE